MTDSPDGVSDDDAARLRAARQAEAEQTVADIVRQAQTTHRSAADSLDRAADSHVAAARIFDDGAEQRPEREDEFNEHAMHHRQLAHNDREEARQFRGIAVT